MENLPQKNPWKCVYFYSAPYSRCQCHRPLWKIMTSSKKTEIRIILQCHQEGTGTRPRATCTENFNKIRFVVYRAYSQRHWQSHRQTNSFITILCPLPRAHVHMIQQQTTQCRNYISENMRVAWTKALHHWNVLPSCKDGNSVWRTQLVVVGQSWQHLRQSTCCGEKADKNSTEFRVTKVSYGSTHIYGDVQVSLGL